MPRLISILKTYFPTIFQTFYKKVLKQTCFRTIASGVHGLSRLSVRALLFQCEIVLGKEWVLLWYLQYIYPSIEFRLPCTPRTISHGAKLFIGIP